MRIRKRVRLVETMDNLVHESYIKALTYELDKGTPEERVFISQASTEVVTKESEFCVYFGIPKTCSYLSSQAFSREEFTKFRDMCTRALEETDSNSKVIPNSSVNELPAKELKFEIGAKVRFKQVDFPCSDDYLNHVGRVSTILGRDGWLNSLWKVKRLDDGDFFLMIEEQLELVDE